MRSRLRTLFAAVSTIALTSTIVHASDPERLPRDYSGGEATIFDESRHAFSRQIPGLTSEQRSAFFVGNSFFNQAWIVAPASAEGRDGLGPLFNTRSCSACHLRDGRGFPPDEGKPFSVMLLRISVPGQGPHGAPVPDPIYGGQIQGKAILNTPAEADVVASFKEVKGRFADGEEYSLRRPTYRLENLGYGHPHQGLLMSPRTAPVVIGLGLLEAIPERTLQAMADPDDADQDGISGRLNRVWDVLKRQVVTGRFGWKAEQPTVQQQVAGAFNGDMGLTTRLFTGENHTDRQAKAKAHPSGGQPEVTDKVLDAVVSYSRTLAVPGRRDIEDEEVIQGEKLFTEIGCTDCHKAQLRTGQVDGFPTLSNQTIQPFTDLLLHDLGEGLADHRPTFAADGREWRTAPLWGVGLVKKVNGHTYLLHDGRARNLTEAILWHGGEGESSKEKFRNLPRDQRQALIRFLNSL